MRLTEDQHVVQALTTQRPNQTLGKRARKDVATILSEVLHKTVHVRVGDHVQARPKIEAALEVALNLALREIIDVDSTPRAYRLKASNAAPLISTSAGTFPRRKNFPSIKGALRELDQLRAN